MPRYGIDPKTLESARLYLRNNEKRRIKVTLADVAQPVELCAIETGNNVGGTTPEGDMVEFAYDDIRMIAFVPADPVGPEERDIMVPQIARRLSSLPEVIRRVRREYDAISQEQWLVDLIESETEDGDTSPLHTFVRIEVTKEIQQRWRPFVEREDWHNAIAGTFGVRVEDIL